MASFPGVDAASCALGDSSNWCNIRWDIEIDLFESTLKNEEYRMYMPLVERSLSPWVLVSARTPQVGTNPLIANSWYE